MKRILYLFSLMSLFIVLIPCIVNGRNTSSQSKIILTPEERSWLTKHPDIVLGTSTQYPPWTMKKTDGIYFGILPDLYRKINRLLGTRIRLRVGKTWADTQTKAKKREVDGLAGAGRDPNRDKLYNPTMSFVSSYFSVYAPSKNRYKLKSLSDLKRMRVGHKRGARPAKTVIEKIPSAVAIPYDNHESITKALLSKEIDYAIAWVGYEYWRKKNLRGKIDNILLIDEYPIKMVTYIRKDWPELIPILNKAIASIQKDGMTRITDKWFGKWPRSSTFPLTMKERKWIKDHPEITLGTDSSWAPYVIVKKDGSISGIEDDYIKLINDLTGTNIRIVAGKWTDMVNKAKAKKIDGLVTSAYHREREQYFNFTESPYSVYKYIFTSSLKVKSMYDLVGLRVAYLKGNKAEEKILRKQPGIIAVPVDTYSDMILMIENNKADAMIGGNALHTYIHDNVMPDIKLIYLIPESEVKVLYSIRKDWPELKSIINKALVKISPGKRASIKNKWVGIRPAERFDYTLLWQILIGSSLILFLVLFWNRRLKSEVLKRTSELQKSEELFRSLFETNQAIKLLIDPETDRIKDANSAACSFYGYPKEKLLSMKITDINQLSEKEVHDEMKRAKSEQKLYFNFKHRLIAGEVRDVEVYSGPIEVKGKRYLYSIVHDITERKHAEDALQKNQYYLTKAQEIGSIGTWELDLINNKLIWTDQN